VARSRALGAFQERGRRVRRLPPPAKIRAISSRSNLRRRRPGGHVEALTAASLMDVTNDSLEIVYEMDAEFYNTKPNPAQ
jgi:hypothetical protein